MLMFIFGFFHGGGGVHGMSLPWRALNVRMFKRLTIELSRQADGNFEITRPGSILVLRLAIPLGDSLVRYRPLLGPLEF